MGEIPSVIEDQEKKPNLNRVKTVRENMFFEPTQYAGCLRS